MRNDDIFNGNEMLSVLQFEQPRQKRRNFQTGKTLFTSFRVTQHHRNAQRQPRYVGKRVSWVYNKRGENGENTLVKFSRQNCFFCSGNIFPTLQNDVVVFQLRQNFFAQKRLLLGN